MQFGQPDPPSPDSRWAKCGRCDSVFPTRKHDELHLQIGQHGVLWYSGMCPSCVRDTVPALSEQLEGFFDVIWKEEAWVRTEARIDMAIQNAERLRKLRGGSGDE